MNDVTRDTLIAIASCILAAICIVGIAMVFIGLCPLIPHKIRVYVQSQLQ